MRRKQLSITYEINIVLKLSRSFSSRGVDPKDLQLFLQTYVGNNPPFEFNRNDNLKDVFIAISKRSSWFNDDLFLVIVNEIGTKVEKKSMQDYHHKTLIPYLRRYIFEIPSKSCSPCDPQSPKICLFLKVFDNILLTALEIKAIKCNLADMFRINKSIFYFDRYEEGCFELFFTVNKEVFSPQESVFLEWVPSKEAFRITTDLVTIL